MVSAIESIAKREGILEKTHFYLAEQDTESEKYIFRDLDGNIEKIFDSFNIAIDRINTYGQTLAEMP